MKDFTTLFIFSQAFALKLLLYLTSLIKGWGKEKLAYQTKEKKILLPNIVIEAYLILTKIYY